MLRSRSVMICGAFLCFALHANAQGNHVGQNAGSDRGIAKVTAETRGTEQAPFFIKVIPPKKSKAESVSQEKKESEGVSVEKRVADLTGDLATYTEKLYYATVALAALTAGLLLLGFLQRGDNKRAIKTAEESAEAAKLSAQAAVVQLKAFVAIQAVALENVGEGLVPRAVITFKNTGLSPAFNVTQTGTMGIDYFPEPQGKPDLGGPVSRESQPLGPGVEIGMPVQLPRALQAHHIGALLGNTMALYVFGTVSYADAFGEKHSYPIALYSNLDGGMREGRMAAFIGDPKV
jgi:hypothetical protein